MTHDPAHHPATLSEADAQQLLARAAALDVHFGAAVPLSRLRQAAREAGLSDAAFDAALDEIRRIPPAVAPSTPRMWSRLARIAGVAVGAYALFAGGALLLNDSSAAWLMRKLFDPVALGLGAAVAARFGVRPVALLLSGFAVATGAEFAMDLWTGQPAIRGVAPHVALLLAGLGGVLLGARWFRSAPREAPLMREVSREDAGRHSAPPKGPALLVRAGRLGAPRLFAAPANG